MATLGNKKAFSGMVGNVVFKELNGRQVVQSRPSKVRQTTATKKSASEFGECSRWARQLRKALHPLLVGLTDSTMHPRFNAAMYSAIKHNTLFPKGERTPLNSAMEPLQGFEFNTHSPFASHFRPHTSSGMTAANEATISVAGFDPAEEMVFPPGCDNAKLITYALATDFSETGIPQVFHSILELSKGTPIPAQTLLTTTPLPQGYFVLAAVKLLYYKPNPLMETNYLNTKILSRATILLARTTTL